ncbi:internalin, putative [Indibacter alkaliphilus LW1]|uniref:Internalin, putative n=1 Tax=Indibacter alkaliphilus (strain CCUG 57479 / KCTC 22604 / LW1) TaxID=1189612 RepID=S2DJD6_INDAL|nr:gliding motility-associated C-terminal domain-containing protein [Indibacter alkaliphilus]EOZ92061.1 internalin, putative [Indibacter alkaliphilus LW1]
MNIKNYKLPTFLIFLIGVLAIVFMEDTLAQGRDKNQENGSGQRTENVPSGKLEVAVSGKLALCSHEDRGHIILGVSGGVEPYTFKWNNNDTVQNRYNLFSGTYTVVITDNEGKTITERIVVQPPLPLIVDLKEKKDASCGSSADGSARIEIKFGRGEPYTITWSHGLQGELEADKLLPGSYTVTVADHLNCDITISFEIGQESEGIEVSEAIEDIGCTGNEKGAIFLDVKGGSGKFSYQWSNGKTSKDLSGLDAGIYEVTIQDEEGCSVFRTYEVVSTASVIDLELVRVQHIQCAGSEDGEIEIAISGGVAPYTVQWDNGASSEKLNALKAGKYSVKVSDGSGCTVSRTVEVNEPAKLTAFLESSVDMDCSTGESKTYVWVNVAGGQSPYSILWSDGSKDIKEVEASNMREISVEVEDAMGCKTNHKIRLDNQSIQTGLRVDFQVRKLEINAESEVFTSEPLLFESEISEEFIAWEWDFGDGNGNSEKDPIHVFEKPGLYEVTLRAYDLFGCSSVESKEINVLEVEKWITIPNAFSPNGDGLNDTFKPMLKGVSSFKMDIFNNWGEHMYTSSGLEFEGWDGTYKGKLLPRGSYVYQISFTKVNGEKEIKTGSLTLIR